MSNVFAKVETVIKKRFDLALAQYNIDNNCQLTQAEIIAHLLRKFSDSVLGKIIHKEEYHVFSKDKDCWAEHRQESR